MKEMQRTRRAICEPVRKAMGFSSLRELMAAIGEKEVV